MPIRCGNPEHGREIVYHDGVEDVRACCRMGQTELPLGEVPAAQRAPSESWRTGSTQDVPDGLYRLPGDATVYKVLIAVHGSGRKYVKKLVVGKAPDDHSAAEHHWAMVPRFLPNIMSRGKLMTLEEAKEFGAIYGFCCRCGRTLTNETSIEEGIGPICSGKFA